MNQNNRPLGWTTLEEAQQLVEAGLPVETADMHYLKIIRENDVRYIPELLLDDNECDIPCWSLGALVQVLPLNIQTGDSFLDKYNLEFKLYSEYKYKIAYCLSQSHYPMIYTEEYKTLIEACVEMIIWLLNNKFYEQEKC